MRIIIAGGRFFNDYNYLKKSLDPLLGNYYDSNELEIVSGGAIGVDALGERYAKEKGFTITKFNADWEKYGKSAGPIRNKQMADYAHGLIAFWDGESKGTKNMIKNAQNNNLKVFVFNYKDKSLMVG